VTTEEIKRLFNARRAGTYRGRRAYQGKCPIHNDRMASLSITEPERGKSKVKCFAGCDDLAVLSSKGLTFSDLYAEKRSFQPMPIREEWITKEGPIWFSFSDDALEMAVACAILL